MYGRVVSKDNLWNNRGPAKRSVQLKNYSRLGHTLRGVALDKGNDDNPFKGGQPFHDSFHFLEVVMSAAIINDGVGGE